MDSHPNLSRRVSALLAFATLAALSLYVVLPGFRVGFVSDDFFHLVSDQGHVWYYSSDELYRPLRNGVFKLVGSAFGLEPAPYRAIAFSCYVLCAVLAFRLFRRLELPPLACWCAVILIFLSPHNHALLFWWAAVQDVFSVACVLGMLLCWIDFRRSGRLSSLGAALVLDLCAMGFKETAVVAPALVLCIDWYMHRDDLSWFRNPATWRPLLSFLIPSLIFAVFIWWYPYGHFRARHTEAAQSTYGLTNAGGIVMAELRSILNLILPFSRSFGLRQIGTGLLVNLAVCLSLLAILFAVARRKSLWLFALLWMLAALLPTSVFARTVAADYYLFLASFGIAIAVACSFDDLRVRFGKPALAAAAVFLVVYSFTGAFALAKQRDEWKRASLEAERVIDQTTRILPRNAGPEVEFINVPHNLMGKPVLNNGLHGALIGRGYSPSLILKTNHDSPPSEAAQTGLRTIIGACPMSDPASPKRILLVEPGTVSDRTGPCASRAADADFAARPWAWH